MRVGIQLPEVERVVRRDELASMARAAEECGFDSLWVGDHLLYRGDARGERGPWDCWTTLAWLAGITERVELGPLVACTAFHPPGILARQAAAVHELSGGRLVAALGAGWNQDGVPRVRAAVRPSRLALRGGVHDHPATARRRAGELRRAASTRSSDAVLLPPLERKPKLMIGANAPRMLSITLPHVDAWNTWFTPYGNTVEGFAKHNAEVSAAADRAGRDPAEIERSACVLVEIDGGTGERPRDVPAVPVDALAGHLSALGEAGADEAILVLDPITESSIRSIAAARSAV